MVTVGNFKRFLWALGFWGVFVGSSQARDTFYYLTLQASIQDSQMKAPGEKDDSYLQEIKKDHGRLKGDRKDSPTGIAFDFYQAEKSIGSGFGVAVENYEKTHTFDDHSTVHLDVRALRFTLTGYYRGGWWFPYFELGTGNYYVKLKEVLESSDEAPIKASFIDSTPHSYHYGVGTRIPFGSWGVLLGWRATAAKIKIQTNGERLELGGQSITLGGFYGF